MKEFNAEKFCSDLIILREKKHKTLLLKNLELKDPHCRC